MVMDMVAMDMAAMDMVMDTDMELGMEATVDTEDMVMEDMAMGMVDTDMGMVDTGDMVMEDMGMAMERTTTNPPIIR